MGTKQDVASGDSWKAPTTALTEAFAKRGIVLKDDQVKGKVSLEGPKPLASMACWILKEDLRITDVKDFSFSFNAEVWLPVDDTIGPLKIIRKATETATRALPDNNILSKGMNLQACESESFTGMILPIATSKKAK